MTAKRFTIDNDMNFDNKVETYELNCMRDSENQAFYFIADSIENVQLFIKRLNELYEENQDLKAFNQDLSEELSVCGNARISKDDWIEKLIEENKQLKEALKELKEIGDYQSDRIQELDVENEQLKQRLKEIE